MRKIYFKLLTGAIGLEAYNTKVFFFYIPYLRANGVEPVAVVTGYEPTNRTLWSLVRKKLEQEKIEYIDVSDNRILSVYYNRIKMRPMARFSAVLFAKHVGDSRRYLDHLIHRNYKYAEPPGNQMDFDAINDAGACLRFSDDENAFRAGELRKMNVNAGFVCVHSRDGAYYYPEVDTNRNTPFENYLQSCSYLGECGLHTLRMGAKQVRLDREIFNERTIDYSGEYRTDFMDIWLVANCKFFLGNNSGFYFVPYLFNKPCAIVNYPNFMDTVPLGINDIYTPQKLWDKNRKRLLTFKEIAEYDIGLDWGYLSKFKRDGIECLQTTPEEIRAVAKEMNEVLDGTYQYTEEDNYLQQKFRSIFKVYHAPYHSPARVGREFLKQNKELFL